MKPQKALEIQNNFEEISSKILSAIDFLKCIDFNDTGIEDPGAITEMIEVLELIFEDLNNYPSLQVMKDILDIEEIVNYGRKDGK